MKILFKKKKKKIGMQTNLSSVVHAWIVNDVDPSKPRQDSTLCKYGCRPPKYTYQKGECKV